MFKGRTLPASAVAIMLAGTMIGGAHVVADETGDVPAYSQALADLNVKLANAGVKNFRIEKAEFSVTAAGASAATTVFANDRTHQLDSQFVASDSRRAGGHADLSYLVDQSDGRALGFNAAGVVVLVPNSVTEPAIDRAMHNWGNQTQCPSPALAKLPDTGADPDIVDDLVSGAKGIEDLQNWVPFADITQAGWLGASFFDALVPNGSQFILGVTFTFVFTDEAGNPTDVDHDGKEDVAFSEIYYNRSFPWTADPRLTASNFDIETVSTHESGHALGLGHFGKIFVDNRGVPHFAPRAIMNAIYAGPLTDLKGTDNASYCSIWASRR